MDRRSFLRGLVAASAATAFGCTRPSGVPGKLRIGYLTNLTHAPMLLAIASQRLAKALPGVEIETRVFRAGPRVCEALLGNAIDVGVTGPAPVVAMHARHAGAPFAIVSGVSSGGASLIALPNVRGADELRGKRVASPQIGTTQDVALRKWLGAHGLVAKERGGDVIVDALASSNILEQMRRGQIAAAWLPEAWATRVVEELSATRLVDERELWVDRKFPSALLVARRPFVEARRPEVDVLVRVLHDEIHRMDAGARDAAAREIKRLTGKGLPKKVVEGAWQRIDFLDDPLPTQLASFAEDARALGYVPDADVRGLLA